MIRTDERSWQLGLNEREINQIIRGDAANDSQSKKSAQKVCLLKTFKTLNFIINCPFQ